MQKTLLIMGIVFVTLACTACVNRFAVQELNNNAKELMASGNTEAAISRLESSIDLDESVFETHYNLAVAYIQAEKYDKALKSLEKVIELNPDFADAYHSLGVVYEEQAYDIISGDADKENADSDAQKEEVSDNSQPKKLTDAEKEKVCELFTNAIDNYNKYLTKKSDASDKDKVNSKIEDLNKELRVYSTEVEPATKEE